MKSNHEKGKTVVLLSKNIVVLLFLVMLCACGNTCKNTNGEGAAQTDSTTSALPLDSLYQAGLPRTAKLADSNDSLSVFLNNDKKAKYDEEAYITSVYVFDNKTKKLEKLLTTTEPEEMRWYKPTCEDAVKCSLTDIHAIYKASLFPFAQKLMLCGCFDQRNVFSYIVDLNDKSAMLLPTNQDNVGFTLEEGYPIMLSYEYNNAVDKDGDPVGGRHTVLSVFDENGGFIKSLDLESKK